jgi:hypothetical protein
MQKTQNELSAPLPQELVGGRYRIESVLGRGGMGTVYRANDLLGGGVALKRLHVSVEELAQDMTRTAGQTSTAAGKKAVSLAHEFRTLSSLRHPNVISVLDYGFDAEQRPYLTMELLDRAQTFVLAAKDKSYAERLQLLTQVLQALAYLHRRGVIHRDLKPANVLVVGSQVKVLDFGISLAREEWKNQELASSAGTPGYVAPELLRGEVPSEASDLYSFGLMAAQLLSSMPMTERNPQVLLSAIQEPAVAQVLGRLLDPDPRARYASAEDVISALRAATGSSLATETAATRESFLQAARYVGREAERKRLEQSLDAAIGGRGAAWLVGGESGIGKSRFIERIRAQAQVKGALVLHGQAVSEGGSPYQVWRNPLRWVPLLTTLNDLEAGVLKPLVPGIEKLLGREVPDPPPLDADMARGRLLDTIEAILCRLTQPVVLVLEDLHWESNDSLALLTRMVGRVGGLRMLVLAAYRDDERPDLPKALPEMEGLKLTRLNAEEIALLSESMLGKAGRQPQLLQRLQQETEGNPFFLVEVVRALAEEAGRLDRIGEAALPEKLLGSGMRAVLQRRLAQVPTSARELLELAAILGREIDTAALEAVAPTADLESWLRACASVAVLETHDERWRFAHDKLRESLLEALPPERLPALHRRAAEALESSHPQDARYVAALARHWRQAGDTHKEAFYAGRAGEDALRLYGATREAIPYLERARDLVAGGSEPDSFRLGHLELLLADAHLRQGAPMKCEELALRAMTRFGWSVPSSKTGWRLAIVREWAVRFHQATRLEPWDALAPRDRDVRLKLAEILVMLAEVSFYLNRPVNMLWSALKGLNVSDPAGTTAVQARAYSVLALAMGVGPAPLRPLAAAWCEHARGIIQHVGTPTDKAYVLVRLGVSYLQRGDWARASSISEEAVRLIPVHRDTRLTGESQALLAQSHMFAARFALALPAMEQMAESSRRGDRQSEVWALLFIALLQTRLGIPNETVQRIQAQLDAFSEAGHVINIIAHGMLGLAALNGGEPERARALVLRTEGWLDGSRPVTHWLYFGLAAVAEVLCRVLEHHAGTLDAQARQTLEAVAEKACRSLEACAEVFGFALPAALLWRATLNRLTGHPSAAHRQLKRALTEAQRRQMLHEEGLIRLELGRASPLPASARQAHLRRAVELMRELKCAPDLARAEAALAQREA